MTSVSNNFYASSLFGQNGGNTSLRFPQPNTTTIYYYALYKLIEFGTLFHVNMMWVFPYL